MMTQATTREIYLVIKIQTCNLSFFFFFLIYPVRHKTDRQDHFRFHLGKLAGKLIAQEYQEFFFLVGKRLPPISGDIFSFSFASYFGRAGREHCEIYKNTDRLCKLAKYCLAKYTNLRPSCPCCVVLLKACCSNSSFFPFEKNKKKGFKVSCRVTKFWFRGIITQNLQIFLSRINLARRTICRVHLR